MSSPVYRIASKRDYLKKRGPVGSCGQVKQTVKYLAVCKDPRIQREILRTASDTVYKSICNAFFNVAENPDINISPKLRQGLRRHGPSIQQLLEPKLNIKRKRKIIQRGGGPFLALLLPSVLSTALSFLGSAFLKRDQ